MAGRIVTNSVQLGDSATANNNFVWQTNVDGTAKLSRGVVGALTQDILAVDALGGIAFPQHRFSGVNLLMNGLFTINQRVYVSGTATVAASQYTVDRWRVVTLGQNVTWTASGNGNQITAPAGGIEQVIEGASINVTQGVVTWLGTATCTVDGTARAKGDTFTLVPGTNCSVRFFNGTVSQVQVEAGRAPTAFQFRTSQEELLLCRRYYNQIRWWWQGSSAGLGQGQGWTWVFPCSMRITPTLAFFNVVSGLTPSSAGVQSTDSVGISAVGNGNGQVDVFSSASAEL